MAMTENVGINPPVGYADSPLWQGGLWRLPALIGYLEGVLGKTIKAAKFVK